MKEENFPVEFVIIRQGEHLIRHEQSVHQGRKFPGGSCDYQATRIEDLTKHQQSLHEGM